MKDLLTCVGLTLMKIEIEVSIDRQCEPTADHISLQDLIRVNDRSNVSRTRSRHLFIRVIGTSDSTSATTYLYD